jgi:plasmid stabilization system protein ParE
MWSVPGFRKHLIFYLPEENGVEVVQVLHGVRELGAVFDEDE